MSLTKRDIDFINSEEGIECKRLLKVMVSDDAYNTEPSYSANSDAYPDNLIPFIDKHMNYLCTHPTINPYAYLSNLRLMTRVTSATSPR
ncbi:MAG TPA: hypothetical protein VLE69_02630 [Candidatus Saccharimonadales bacterium]|nr:hypothetical protein [Candidatus Saccharimonadales bacterium]